MDKNIQRYNQSCQMIKILLGDLNGKGRQLEFIDKFGIKEGYTFFIWTDHCDYLNNLNKTITEEKMLNVELANRWKLVNKLILVGYSQKHNAPEFIVKEALNLAALVAYPLMEEASRNISKAWDEEGTLLKEISSSFGLPKNKKYKKGERIISLEHKLIIMKKSLGQRLQRAIDSLDRRMRRSSIKGNAQERAPLFERLAVNRNKWLHGRKFQGWEAIFISLFLSMIYFGQTIAEILDQAR